MPKFRVTIERKVSSYDQFSRVIEAENEREAWVKADEMALDADHDCPDDCSESPATEIGDFYTNDVEPADETEEADA